MSGPVTPGGGARAPSWQERLDEYCRSTGASAPKYNIVSDRRGGRTAWSATVQIQSVAQNFQARFWYDGQYVNNAKEDAAEVALKYLGAQHVPPPVPAVPTSLPTGTPASGGLSLRGGAAPGFTVSNLLPNIGGSSQQLRATGEMGVAWARSPAPQQGFAPPSAW